MAKPFKYYYDLISQPSRAMYIIFKLSKTPFESVPVALRKREHFTEDYKKNVNRFQKIPCIVEENDFKLSESIAILRYLHSDGRILENLYPSDLKIRAKTDEFLQWQHLNIRMTCSLYFLYYWREPLLTGKPPNPDKVEKLKHNMEKSLDNFEINWLDSHKFIASDFLTVADIFAACELEQPKVCGYDCSKDRPKLSAWIQMVRDATNPFYDEAHEIVKKYAARKL